MSILSVVFSVHGMLVTLTVMPRPPRADESGGLFHALNRANLRATIFHKDPSYGHTSVVTVERSDKFGYTVAHDPQLFFMKDIQSLHAAVGRLLVEQGKLPPS